MKVTVSLSCPNCGHPVIINLEYPFVGGYSGHCFGCGALVSGSYSWNNDMSPIIYTVRSSGGAPKR